MITLPDDSAYYVDRGGFTEMPEFSQKLEDKYKFYVVADLKTWANNENPRSKFEKYDTLDEALSRFKELRSEPYNSETVLNQDNQPYARLTLGVSRQDRTGDLDILQSRDLSPNASGGLTPLSPPSELQEILVAIREQSGVLCFHSR